MSDWLLLEMDAKKRVINIIKRHIDILRPLKYQHIQKQCQKTRFSVTKVMSC